MSPDRQIYFIILNKWKNDNKKFIIHHCSQCEYACGFFWVNNQLYFDSGCFCLVEKEKPRLCSDDELLKFIRENPETIEKIFEEEKIIVN